MRVLLMALTRRSLDANASVFAMGDTLQNEGSDSDWDSTLDFTSPRQTGKPYLPRIGAEIDQISEYGSSDDERSATHSLEEFEVPTPAPTGTTDLKPKVETGQPPSPAVSERQLSPPKKTERPSESQQGPGSANQPGRNVPAVQDNPPPYNFRQAVTESITPEPVARRPGKDRKGTTYDMAPSPSPRGIPVNQNSIRSVGSWDDSDPDERTLRELRQNYDKQKQREEEQKLKQREMEASAKSEAEELPQTARSESTWKSWAGSKFGKRPKSAQQLQQQPAAQRSPQPGAKQAAQKSTQLKPQPQPASRSATPTLQVRQPQAHEVMTLAVPTKHQRTESQSVQEEGLANYEHNEPNYYFPAPEVIEPEEEMEEPKKLFFRDEITGRYVYFFGHGNLRFYEVHEEFEEAIIPSIADRVERVVRRVWLEFFAILRILTSVLIWFVVELFRFLAQHVLQPIVVGVFVSLGDFIIKPLLSSLFNGCVQPFNIFFWNVFSGMKHMFRPIGVILKRVLEQFALCCRSVRCVEINWKTTHPQATSYRTQTV